MSIVSVVVMGEETRISMQQSLSSDWDRVYLHIGFIYTQVRKGKCNLVRFLQ